MTFPKELVPLQYRRDSLATLLMMVRSEAEHHRTERAVMEELEKPDQNPETILELVSDLRALAVALAAKVSP